MSLHLLKGVAQRGWDGMGTSSVIVAPDHNSTTSSKDTFRVLHFAYLVLHHETRTPYAHDFNANFRAIGTHQWQFIGTGILFDEYAIMIASWACANTRIGRFSIR